MFLLPLAVPFFSILLSLQSFAFNPPDEGMWLPLLIDRLNYTDMQKMDDALKGEDDKK